MYRTNAQSRVLEEAFLRAGLPYKLVGAQRFYGRREIKDVIAYLRLIHNPRDEFSLTRAINTPPRGIGNKTFVSLRTYAQKIHLTPGEMLLEIGRPGREPTPGCPSGAGGADAGELSPSGWRNGTALAAGVVAAATDGPHPE